MSLRSALIGTVLTTMLFFASNAHALAEFDQPRSPGAGAGAALINVVYSPIRFGVSVLGACFSGLSGWLTGGDLDVAEDIWGQFRGPAHVTPEMLQGREPFRFGPWQTGR